MLLVVVLVLQTSTSQLRVVFQCNLGGKEVLFFGRFLLLLSSLLSCFLCSQLSRQLLGQQPAASSQETYKHTHSQMHKRFGQCTDDQMNGINQQLGLDKTCNAHWFECGICSETKCPVSSWIEDFYLEDEGITEDSSSFLGVSIGCNKGYDAISTARMGMSNVEFDKNTWQSALGINNEGVCKQKNAGQPNISKPSRQGEMHCVEPMPSTFERLSSAVSALDLESKEFRCHPRSCICFRWIYSFPIWVSRERGCWNGLLFEKTRI